MQTVTTLASPSVAKRAVAVGLASLAAVGLAGAAPARADHANGIACSYADTQPQPATSTVASNYVQLRSAILCLVNEMRRRNGRVALVRNSLLEGPAQSLATDMVRRRYCSHTTPEGVGITQRYSQYRSGFGTWGLGENLTTGSDSGGYSTPRAAVNRWMHSDPHRANILNASFRDSGVGVMDGMCNSSLAGGTYVQGFGYRR